MRFSLANLFGLAMLPVLAAATANAADLVLLERVEPSSGVVRLADVAAILNAGPEEIEALGKIPLMPSPAPGDQQTVRSQSIRELLSAHGVDLSGVRFRGASHTLITSRFDAGVAIAEPTEPQQPVASPPQTGYRGAIGSATASQTPRPPARQRVTRSRLEQLQEELAEKLTGYVQHQAADGMLYVMGVELPERNAATLAANRSELAITASGPLRPGAKRFLIAFDTAAGPVKFPVTARIVEARPAVLFRRDVPRGMTITAADVHVAPLPTDFRPRGVETIAATLDEVIGKESAYAIRPGDVATDGNCLQPLMVERNSLVTVSSGRGAIRVRLQAKARSEGRLGETIQVETLDTRERFEARVVGRNQLAVLTIGGAAAQSIAENLETLRLR